MSEIERRYKLYVDDRVAGDLTYVRGVDSYAHKHVLVFLEEINGGQIACQWLVDEYYSDDLIENIEPFWFLQNEKRNIHRIKLVDVKGWRIITAGDHRQREIAVLAIMKRDQDYQSDKALVQRLRDSYEKLCFSRLG